MTFREYLEKNRSGGRTKGAVYISPDWNGIPAGLRTRFKSAGAALYASVKPYLYSVKDTASAAALNVTAFESFGLGGIVAMQSVIDDAKKLSIPVIALTEKCGSTMEDVKLSAKAWLAPVDANLPEDDPRRAGAFDCDAMTFNAAALSGANAGYVAGEVERYGAGVLMQCGKDPARGIQLAEAIGTDTCGVVLSGSCRELISVLKVNAGLISLVFPTGVDTASELKELGALATLVAPPAQVRDPESFTAFCKML